MPIASHVTVRKRIVLFLCLICLVMAGLTGRLIFLQFFQSSWLAENAVDQRVREIPVEAKRGIIFDRNGRELAVSVSSASVYAIPAEITNAEETAAKLAAILNLDNSSLTNKLKKRQAFTWIKRKIDNETAGKLQTLNLPGIGITQEGRRYYPNDAVASHILGFTGIDSQGLDGVEITFDSYLKGRPGSIVIEYDGRGREIPLANHRYVAPVEGNNLYLTIDLVIQQIAEREAERVMRENQAQAATIIVMKPGTGEILALANKPDYDPNHFADYSPKLWRNIAISNAYEPGSTFKIITSSAVLGDKVVRLKDRFFDPGEVEVQGRTIHCWKHGGHGSQSFEEVVQNSCNVGFVNVGLKLGADAFYRYIDNFGFGKPTGIDLPGEAKGIMIDKAKIKPINIATMAIGQSIAVTPMQLISAVSAVANDGILLRPQIVREVKDKAGTMIRSFQPDTVKKILEPEVSRELKGILEKVVENGTGRNAFLEGFHVAGKTGTAQKVGGGGYAAGKYVASFVGFAPADHPQVAVLVIIDEPTGMYYGGQIAAPVFGAVVKDVLPYLKVTPEFPASETAPAKQTHVLMPSLINLTLAEAGKEIQKAGLQVRIEEDGDRVADQIPKPGSRIPLGGTVLLYTRTPRFIAGEVTLPDFRGSTLKEAINILSELGLIVRQEGTGSKVGRQDPPPGKQLNAGSSVTLYLED